jgi:hypothetical protein
MIVDCQDCRVRAAIDARVLYIKGPECGGVMSRRNLAWRSGVIVDVCNAFSRLFR